LEECSRDQVKGLLPLTSAYSCACRVEMRKINSPNDGTKYWIFGNMGKEFAEYPRMGKGDLGIKSGEGGRVNPT